MTTPTLTLPTFDMTSLYALAGAVLGGLAVMWLIRKAIKTTNHS